MANSIMPLRQRTWPERKLPELEVSAVNVVNRAWSGHPAWRTLVIGLAGLLSVYLIGRGIAEFFTVHYSDPASYRDDWGGPSLAGVFAVHSGPAVLAVLGWTIYLRRKRRTRADRSTRQLPRGRNQAHQ